LRTALGAGRGRLIRQLLTESVLLAAVGGIAGLVLAYWGVKLLVAFSPKNIPRLDEVTLDGRVLGFTLLVSLLTGVIFGLLPALQASKPDLNETLKEGGRSAAGAVRSRVRNIFVIAEVALSLVLLIGAGLMIKSFVRLQDVNPGFDPDRLLTMRLLLPGSKYREEQQRVAFYQQLEERLKGLPGVQSVGAINWLPLSGLRSATSFVIEGRPEPPPGEKPVTDVRIVTPGFFNAMGIRLLKGRLITEADKQGSPRVVVINETMARLYWPDEDPIGKRIVVSWSNPGPDEIVGVVSDIKDLGLDTDMRQTIYWPQARYASSFMNILMRTAGDPVSLSSAAQAEVRAMDADQPVADIRPMGEVVAESISRQRFNMLLLAIFAAVALVLAAVGIYGVIGYSVTQRTHEIGVRMALGARPADIMKMVVGQGLLLTAIGLTLGVGASLLLTRIMTSLLFTVSATDLTTFAGVSVVLAAVATLASYVPARRATKVDPMVALRYE
jgi:putative ABC transport system permease protein